MDSTQSEMRFLSTLTSDEIIAIVDVLAFCSRTVINGGDMRYRKIEAKLAPGVHKLSCRITYAESVNDQKEVLGFLIEHSFGDLIINPVNRQKYTQQFVDDFQITFDFGILEQSLKQNYLLFADTLRFWNPEPNNLIPNINLGSGWSTIEEFARIDSGVQEYVAG